MAIKINKGDFILNGGKFKATLTNFIPTPTKTPTPQITPSTTSTLTATPTQSQTFYYVDLYAKLQSAFSPVMALTIEYSFDGESFEDFELYQIDYTTCTYGKRINNIPKGTTLYLRTVYGPDVIKNYSIVGSSTCPNSGTGCLTSFVVTGNTDVAFTILITGGAPENCFLPTPTQTPTKTPSVTPTPTSGIKRSITVYAGTSLTPPQAAKVLYSVNGGSYIVLNTFNSTTCSNLGAISNIINGNTLSIYVTSQDGSNVQFGAIDNNTNCGSVSDLFQYCGPTNPLTITVDSTRSVAIRVPVSQKGASYYWFCPS